MDRDNNNLYGLFQIESEIRQAEHENNLRVELQNMTSVPQDDNEYVQPAATKKILDDN